jgi:hypothetical protein
VIGLELSTAFVEGDGMAEGAYDAVISRERQTSGEQSDRVNGIPNRQMLISRKVQNVVYTPNSEELDWHLNSKSFFESSRLFPSNLVVALEHFVCERDLLVITGRQKTDFVKHSSQTASGISSSGKTEDADFIPIFVWRKKH